MGSPTLQTHQDPILMPWLWFEVADQPWPSRLMTNNKAVWQQHGARRDPFLAS
jgi:hypothetical protein